MGKILKSKATPETDTNNKPKVIKKILKSKATPKLGADEKAKFKKQANEGKQKHDAKMKASKEANDPLSALKEKYADLIPKKPAAAYAIYALDAVSRIVAEKALKDAGEEASHLLIGIQLGELWQDMSEADKEPWNEKAKKAAAEYEEKKKVWEATPEFTEYSKVEREQKEKTKDEKKEETKDQKEKKKAAAKEVAKEEKSRCEG